MDNKTAIITAASQGIGEACARELSKLNYNLVIMSSSEKIHTLAHEIGCVGVKGSVTNPEDLEKTVELALSSFGGLDSVVNNTGHAPKGDLLEISDQEWLFAIDILLMNVIRISRFIVPVMKKNGGSIVNISAFGAESPSLKFPTSSVVRSALTSYTKLFARRYGCHNIRMNNLLPGFVDSYRVTDCSSLCYDIHISCQII
jgi:NAD(P)-dependent dehydrogenase (short-subunit alcohol dehydrogenase family)